MTEKTAIEKAKEAAERAKNQIENCFPVYDPEIEADPFDWAETVGVRVRSIMANLNEICEAIAAIEAEKPAEDNDAYDVALEILSLGNSEATPANISDKIESFAESYHAEQCKACKK